MRARLRCFLLDERGQATTEYVLIIGLISIPIFLAARLVLRRIMHGIVTALVASFPKG